MRVGLIYDGASELEAMPTILAKLVTEHRIVRHVLADIQPHAPLGQIALSIVKRLPIMESARVEYVIVLFDREFGSPHPCHIRMAREVEAKLNATLGGDSSIRRISVVVKHRTFENWLVADTSALKALPARFSVPKADNARVVPNKADHINGIKLLNHCCLKYGYEKRRDSIRIMHQADPLRVASNSRSFRRLLRELSVAPYEEQSKLPV
ncbi:MAG: DUF4276 family protein [Gemmatimonadetes bacterium]|nr:DUF4276 family protein [Gemmatimonadota bacterium]